MALSKLKKRSFLIDISRVVAIILMIVTHVIALTFNHNDGSAIVFITGMFTGTAAFIMFLFLSGASKYFSLFKIKTESRKEIHLKKIDLIKRSSTILFGYYSLAAFSAFTLGLAFQSNNLQAILTDSVRVLGLLRVPPFTEFLLTFVLLNISTLVFRRVYAYLLNRNVLLFSVAISSYIVGSVLYTVDLGNPILNLYKGLFVGHESLHVFPIFQYFAIYLLGIYFGKKLFHEIKKKDPLEKIRPYLFSYFVGTTTLAILSELSFRYFDIAILNTSVYDARFPPSIGFILAGGAILFGFLYILSFIRGKSDSLKRVITFISRNTFSFFVVHTIILLSLVLFAQNIYADDSWKFEGVLEMVALSIGVLFATAGIIIIWHLVKKAYSKADPTHQLRKIAISILGVFAVLLSLLLASSPFLTESQNAVNLTGGRVLSTENNPENWFSHDYKYYRQVITDTLDADSLFIAGDWVYTQFNHKEAVERYSYMKTNGEDIQVVRLNEDSTYEIVPSQIIAPNSAETRVYWRAEANTAYFIYYVSSNPSASRISESANTETALFVDVSNAIRSNFSTQVSSHWYLKDYSKTEPVTFSVDIPEGISESISVEYEILGTNISGRMFENEALRYEKVLPLEQLDAGFYTVQSTIYELDDSAYIYKTYKEPIYISYPVYVAWSIDWEGWGVPIADLEAIETISRNYSMPITQYFNPRIYIDNQYSTFSISKEGADYLTNWVKNRKALGDEIGLHLHFYPDVLEAAGVAVREDASLIGINRDETYIQAYTYEELDKIFTWALNLFRENGISEVISFRSGAWMSGPDVLKAASDNGILIDSSGRTAGLLNPAVSNSTPIPWNLTTTTRPYKPNFFDINSSAPPNINIWEIPNNGADSFWFSLEDLISRFDENYPGKGSVVEDFRSIVYLSHPHGFTTFDNNKINGLFNYTNNYTYNADKGPVVYETIETIYRESLE